MNQLSSTPARDTDPRSAPVPLLRIALPNKGRLAQDTRDLFNDAGLEVRALSDRALKAALGGEFEAIFVRAQDIPEFVSDGAADAGVTGLDLVRESRRNVSSRLDLGFGRCRLAVAARDDCAILSPDDLPAGSRIATAFPAITQQYFADAGLEVEIVPVSGAAEIAPHLGIADVIVDLVSTGSTLKTNGLREIGTVMVSTAQLVVANDRSRWSSAKETALDELATALESVISARGQRYLMANVPRDRLKEVRDVLPGLNGPTVIDVLDGGRHVAVHAVVSAAAVYRTIANLKALGGEGILVTRIERLMR
ncbi:MAG: ATP phosphoribosyltransferase [Gemmatimonadota bacterium]|nr:ATP phosphoribosyltransferase [Gemmatimonadota bacterium]